MSASAAQPNSTGPARTGRPWQRNPLRTRGHARHEFFVTLLVLVALAMPVLAFLAGRAQFEMSEARSRQLAAENRPVGAVLEQNTYGSTSPLRTGSRKTAVSWTAADGSVRTGRAVVQSPGDKGDHTTIWLDAAGNPAAAPAPHDRIVVGAVVAGLATLLGGFGVLLVAYAVVHTAFMRSRMGAWARDWEQVAPSWTKA